MDAGLGLEPFGEAEAWRLSERATDGTWEAHARGYLIAAHVHGDRIAVTRDQGPAWQGRVSWRLPKRCAPSRPSSGPRTFNLRAPAGRVRLLFELSGEHSTLPAAEALALLGMQGTVAGAEQDDAVLLAEVARPDVALLAARAGLTHAISEALTTCAPTEEAILDAVRGAADRIGPVFRVRCHRVGPHGKALRSSALEREAGAALAQGRRVEMEGPADEVRILLAERAHVGLALVKLDRAAFDARHVRHRPHFSPTSLHPRFARALVNLARVKPGDKVADPFAGTGGLLLEAGLVGAKVVGGDLDPEMADGARRALKHHQLSGEVREGDVAATLAAFAPVDAVVADPPYGRASTTAREPPRDLYRRALTAMHAALNPGGRVAAVFPLADADALAPPGLALEQRHVQRVHRSLDRHYLVFRRT
jgi:tRNA (guanine10-N2)-dimethyltransferase